MTVHSTGDGNRRERDVFHPLELLVVSSVVALLATVVFKSLFLLAQYRALTGWWNPNPPGGPNPLFYSQIVERWVRFPEPLILPVGMLAIASFVGWSIRRVGLANLVLLVLAAIYGFITTIRGERISIALPSEYERFGWLLSECAVLVFVNYASVRLWLLWREPKKATVLRSRDRA
jgi:hypothetical protein